MTQLSKKIIKSHDGLDLYYEIHALGNGKPTLFFLHGVGGDLEAWHFVKDRLSASGFSAIGMDLRGHGHTSHPRSPQSYQMANLVRDISSILEQEKLEKIILIGHCYGAVVASHFAIENAEKLEKLVLISSTYRPPDYLQNKILKIGANILTEMLAFISPKPYKPRHSEYPQGKFHKDYEWFGLARTILHNSWGSYLLTTKEILNLNLEAELKKITTPTLLIAGDKDTIFPLQISQKIHENIPGSKLEVITGANHVVILNNADQIVASLLEFLLTRPA